MAETDLVAVSNGLIKVLRAKGYQVSEATGLTELLLAAIEALNESE